DGVETITSRAFEGCTGISTLTIPASVRTVEADAFKDFYNLERVDFIDWPTWYANVSLGNLYSNPYRVCGAYAGGVKITTPELKEGLTRIEDYINVGLERFRGEVKIPSTVKRIGAQAFYWNVDLTSVILPEGLEEIGENAFEDCFGINTLCLPSTVKSVEKEAFKSSRLSNLILLCKDVKIADNAFDGFGNIHGGMKVCYPLGMNTGCFDEKIQMTFYPYRNTDIRILDDYTVLTDGGKTLLMVPYDCSKDYIIPEGVETILSSAFNGCGGIETLTIPASIKYVEEDAFSCGFNRVNFNDWEAWYSNVKLGNLYSNPYRYCGAYAGGVKITTPELKEGLTRIEDYINVGLECFRDEVEIPSTVKRIGAYAFHNNTELYAVNLPEGLEEIGENAFSGCELLGNIKFPESLKKIGSSAFYGCKSITEVSLPDGVTELGDRESNNTPEVFHPGVFQDCTALEKAAVAVNVDYLEDNLFQDCSSLNKVYLPTELNKIGNNAFNGCSALEEITLPATLEEIGASAFFVNRFSRGSITRLNIPNSVKSLGSDAFRNQPIENLKIGSGLEVIPENAFNGLPIKVLLLSEGLKEIQSGAFASNSSLGSVILPSTVTTIAANAFADTNVLELEIPDKVTSLPAGSCGNPSVLTLGSGVKEINAKAFGFGNLHVLCVKSNTPPTLSDAFPVTTDQNDNLTVIVNNGRRNNYVMNARWKQLDNIIEESSSDVIIYMTGDYALSEEIRTTTGLMPSMVTKMKVVGPLTEHDLDIITQNMISLRSLDMSGVTNVTAIPDGMFAGSLMTDIILPDRLESIGSGAFVNCSLLKLRELPSTLKSIGDRAFYNCPLITFSTLPKSLEAIGESAFSYSGITSVTGGENLRSIGAGAFANNSLLETVDLSNSVLDYLPDNIFSGCRMLDEINLPISLNSIGANAFINTAIRDLSFLKSVGSIDQSAFRNCRRLVSANLPENIETVSSQIFADCPRLISVSMPSTTTAVEGLIVSNDRKLSNISCASVEAPEAATSAFDNIRLRYVSLTVPTTSFRSYLNALQWGKFQSILNRIPVVIDEGVEVTNVAEDEYQDMVREDALEEAQEAAAEERSEEEAEMSRRRVARRAAARAATPRQFAKLFDGAQIQTGNDGSGTRIFITPQEGVEVTSVKFNGEEMISKLEGNSLLLPAGSNGQLEIRTNASGTPTGVGMIYGDIDPEAVYDVYDLNGILIGHDMDSLERGIYIIRQGATVKKINVR
ncbi:MAG: leucine-rich repeat domain-containing protein, partial [Muribaculaceae bacterium]|nr:leucine-rich repeat domain-containing protein [Muribaculaceae bacterium]